MRRRTATQRALRLPNWNMQFLGALEPLVTDDLIGINSIVPGLSGCRISRKLEVQDLMLPHPIYLEMGAFYPVWGAMELSAELGYTTTLTAVVIGGGGQGRELATELFRQANVGLDGTFAGWHRRSPSTLAVMTDLAQQLKPCRPVPQALVFPYQPGGEGQADLGAML